MIYRFFLLASLVLFTACISSNQRTPASEAVTSAETDTTTVNPCQGQTTDVFITIDRNPAVQRMIVCKGGQATYTFPVSTGRETFDIPTNFNMEPSCSRTPLGVFKPGILREKHYSNTWLIKNDKGVYADGAPMDFSIFFDNTGVAIHAAGTPEAAAALGPKTDSTGTGSGGCIRVSPNDARTIFNEFASCAKTEIKKIVCTEREVSLHSSRPANNVKDPLCPTCPKCEKALKQQPVCVEYNKNTPNCSAADLAWRPGHCQDPKQFTVQKQEKTYAIEVKDTRSEVDQKVVADKCLADKEIYHQRKFECLVEKAPAAFNQNQMTQYETIKKQQASDNNSKREQFVGAFKGIYESLPEKTKKDISFKCNEKLYHEAQAQRAQAVASGQTVALPTNTNTQETAALPPPKPKNPGFFKGIGNFFKGIFGKKKQ